MYNSRHAAGKEIQMHDGRTGAESAVVSAFGRKKKNRHMAAADRKMMVVIFNFFMNHSSVHIQTAFGYGLFPFYILVPSVSECCLPLRKIF